MTAQEIDISVIVPFLNEADYIERCIESLLDQDIGRVPVEYIFVDNNSTDRSASIVSKYKKIKLLRENRRHVYVARNAAIDRAKGRILAFTDADCIVSRNWLASILNEFDARKVDILLGERHFSEKASYMARFMEDYENLKIEYILHEKDYKKCFGYANNMAVRRSVYDRLGGFKEDVPLGDTELVIRYVAAHSTPKIGYSASARISHMEISTWFGWLKKLALYGKESPRSGIPLYMSWEKQVGLYRFCFGKSEYSLLESSLFFLTTLCANAAYLVPYLIFGGRKLVVHE